MGLLLASIDGGFIIIDNTYLWRRHDRTSADAVFATHASFGGPFRNRAAKHNIRLASMSSTIKAMIDYYMMQALCISGSAFLPKSLRIFIVATTGIGDLTATCIGIVVAVNGSASLRMSQPLQSCVIFVKQRRRGGFTRFSARSNIVRDSLCHTYNNIRLACFNFEYSLFSLRQIQRQNFMDSLFSSALHILPAEIISRTRQLSSINKDFHMLVKHNSVRTVYRGYNIADFDASNDAKKHDKKLLDKLCPVTNPESSYSLCINVSMKLLLGATNIVKLKLHQLRHVLVNVILIVKMKNIIRLLLLYCGRLAGILQRAPSIVNEQTSRFL